MSEWKFQEGVECNYRSSWRDSGDRGADTWEHFRAYHPDHEHVWIDSTYVSEQAGWTAPVTSGGYVSKPLSATVQRCSVCHISESDNHSGECP
jgi:hypothetical protein